MTENVEQPPITVYKAVAYLPVSHDDLLNFTDHACTKGCPPPPITVRLRWWRLTRRAVAAFYWRGARVEVYSPTRAPALGGAERMRAGLINR